MEQNPKKESMSEAMRRQEMRDMSRDVTGPPEMMKGYAEPPPPKDEKKKPKKMASGGKVSSASKRADGCAVRGKTRGTMVTMKS